MRHTNGMVLRLKTAVQTKLYGADGCPSFRNSSNISDHENQVCCAFAHLAKKPHIQCRSRVSTVTAAHHFGPCPTPQVQQHHAFDTSLEKLGAEFLYKWQHCDF
eukprot:6481446-Amphidinium_carterae.1